ncbi:reticulon-4 receptor [Trichosurus vulpecula]|uniref:reticulon-4 receptor n=1 Tax=Trichosurus vulpecula TaxID=9337 RepID=UPI00186AF2C6|nr:reticulon-4 receptor [Trichosurus vulpecula]
MCPVPGACAALVGRWYLAHFWALCLHPTCHRCPVCQPQFMCQVHRLKGVALPCSPVSLLSFALPTSGLKSGVDKPGTAPDCSHGSKLLIWVLCLNIQSRADSCPGACVCYREPKITTSCQQQGLTAIPAAIPAQSQRIFLHNNRITQVGAASFRSCRNMTILWIHSNAISVIEATAFAGLDKLEELDVSDNVNLRTIAPATFRGLRRLHTLHLDRCGLLELSPGLFRGLFSLQYLYLQDNNLQALQDDTFLDLANLTYLFLHGNGIRNLSENVFRGLVNLDRLLLHQNQVSRVHPRAFHDLGKVMTLYLFNNNLTVLAGETMSPLASLQYLRLNGNPWICDCRAKSLWSWFKQFKGSSSDLECRLPLRLAGKDLKRLHSSDLEGCVDPVNQVRSGTKIRLGKGPTAEPLPAGPQDGPLKCCQPEVDKSFMYEATGHGGPHYGGSPSGNGRKDKENMSKPKMAESDTAKNATQKHINDSPFGTFPSNVEVPLTNFQPDLLEPGESSVAPPRRRPGCSRKNRTKAQCRMGPTGSGSGGGGGGGSSGSGGLLAPAQPRLALGLVLPVLVLWTSPWSC